MHVLIHTDEYCPTAQACANRMRSLADALTDSGAQVTVVCSSANLEHGERTKRAERVIYAPAFRMRKKTMVSRLINNLTFALSSVFCAAGAGRADVVITTSPPLLISIAGWLIARMKGARLIFDVRDIWPDVALEMGSIRKESICCRVFEKIARFMYKHADMVTTVSPGKAEKLQKYIQEAGSDSEKVQLIGNGFDEKILTSSFNEELVERYGFGRSFTCVYIGNIGLAQGLESVLRLAAETKHREARFLLFGSGAEKERLEGLARERGLDNVRFCGVLPPEHVSTVLSSADLSFISLKSAKMKDSIPTKLYEALGIGCPVLLMAEGDACTVLDKTGLGVHLSPDLPEQLVPAFDGIIDRYGEIITHRENAEYLVRNRYSRQKIAAGFAARLYRMAAEVIND